MEGTQQRPARWGMPLYLRVLIGVVLGGALGAAFGTRPYLFGLRNEDLGQLGMLVIRLLKALAVPLVLFAILDAFSRTRISARRGGRLILICLVNVSVAFAIGLTLMNTLQPGRQWHGHLDQIAGVSRPSVAAPASSKPTSPEASAATLNPLKNVAAYVPESLVEPFLKNSIITVVLAGLLIGAALRRVKERQHAEGQRSIEAVERVVEATYRRPSSPPPSPSSYRWTGSWRAAAPASTS